MMKVLLIAATKQEIKPFLERGYADVNLHVCITGVGLVAAAVHATRSIIEHSPDLVIHAGIAGAIDKNLHIAEVVRVEKDLLYDLGVEDNTVFKDVFELSLADRDSFPYQNGWLALSIPKLLQPIVKEFKGVNGISVQKVHGEQTSIETLKKRHPEAGIETMEGAAIHFACLVANVPCLHIRAISNFVEPRNRDNWDIPAAIKSLDLALNHIVNQLST
jgi:futalosine hydrolase